MSEARGGAVVTFTYWLSASTHRGPVTMGTRVLAVHSQYAEPGRSETYHCVPLQAVGGGRNAFITDQYHGGSKHLKSPKDEVIGMFLIPEHQLHKSRGHKAYFHPLKATGACLIFIWLNGLMQKRHTHAVAADYSQTHLQWRQCEQVCEHVRQNKTHNLHPKASKVDGGGQSWHLATLMTSIGIECVQSSSSYDTNARAFPLCHFFTSTYTHDSSRATVTTRPECTGQITKKNTHLHWDNMSQFPQGKTAPIRHRSHECRTKSYVTPAILPVVLSKTTLLSLRDVTVGKEISLLQHPVVTEFWEWLVFMCRVWKLLEGLWLRFWPAVTSFIMKSSCPGWWYQKGLNLYILLTNLYEKNNLWDFVTSEKTYCCTDVTFENSIHRFCCKIIITCGVI